MPRGTQGHPAERVDLVDFENVARDFTEAAVAQNTELIVLDNQARIRRGFRVELPDQDLYPGRIVVYGGDAYGPDGVRLFNEDQLNVSRSITLEGAATDFYVEIQFVEGDGDIDGRAFWDPTVDQGTDPSGDPRPDGQEFSDNVATTKVPDWKIVTPISTSAFERDSNPDSTKIPLIKITTDGTNKINSGGTPSLATDKPATTILEVITTSLLRVQDAQMFPNGSDITVGLGAASQENAVITTADPSTGLITLGGALGNVHTFGEIMKGRLTSSLDLITIDEYGRYGRYNFSDSIDYRDRLFQGDEVHGDILSEGHDTTPDDQSSDVNLQAMKDHIDFLSAQIEEMKWGARNPYTVGTSLVREPPGVANAIPSTPRYFHKAGGIQGARTSAITVGDGVKSWGDFISASGSGIAAAVAQAPAGATIYVKRGTYAIGGDITVNKGLTLIFDTEATVTNDGGGFDLQIPSNQTLIIRGLRMSRGVGGPPTTRALYFNTTNPGGVEISDCQFTNLLGIEVADTVLPINTSINRVIITGGLNTATVPLVQVTNAAGQIRGTFLRCTINNPLGLGLNGSCIQTSTATTGLVRVRFADCLFVTGLINISQIAMGAGSKKVVFERCEFDGILGNSSGNVVASGGTDLRFLHCKGIDTFNRFLSISGATDIQVDGYHNENSISGSHLRFENCSGVKISNCSLILDSAGALTVGAIFLGSNSGTMSDFTVLNNTITATTDNVVGVWVDVEAGGTSIYDLKINNNEFNMCEVPMYFSATAGAGTIDHVRISGNYCVDRGVGTVTASYQKIGILVTTQTSPSFWNIESNHFINLNPATALQVGGAGRAGIWVYSNSMSNFTVANNQMSSIGDATLPSASQQAGIVLASPTNCTISGNSISTVNGENAYGIVLGLGSNVAQDVVCANNDIRLVITGAGGGESFGIVAFGMRNVTFTGNRFIGIITLAAATGAAIGTNNSGLSAVGDVTIAGNTMFGAAGTASFVQFNALSVVNTAITGNTCSTAMRSGVEIISAAGGSLQVITISGNTFANCLNSNIIVLPNTATTRGMTIAGNTLQNDAAAIECIRIDSFTLFNINGNTCHTDDDTIGNNTIYITNSTRFKITDNLCRAPFTGNLINQIRIGATSDFYMINNNMCDGGGSTGPVSITDNGSGATAAYITDNFWDVVPQLGTVSYGNANITAVDAAPLSAKHGNSY